MHSTRNPGKDTLMQSADGNAVPFHRHISIHKDNLTMVDTWAFGYQTLECCSYPPIPSNSHILVPRSELSTMPGVERSCDVHYTPLWKYNIIGWSKYSTIINPPCLL